MPRFLSLSMILVLLLVACGGGPATPTPTVAPAPTATTVVTAGTIVAMGDSLTEGLGVESDQNYPAQLERKLQAEGYNWTVINAGVSGETTTGALERVDWVLTMQPDIVILATGGNDSLRAIDPALTESNLRQLVSRLQAAGATVILAGMQTIQNLGPEYTEAFRTIYPKVAADADLILVPFFLEGVAGDPKLNQEDFIHPTAAGYTIVVETIYPYVVEAIETKN